MDVFLFECCHTPSVIQYSLLKFLNLSNSCLTILVCDISGKEQETLLTSLPVPLSFLSLTLPILSSPLVLDAGRALSLSWGLETDHLLLAENSNSGSGLVWYLVGPSSSAPLSGGPGKSPVTPGYLQVAGDVCKATPFAPSPASSPFSSTWLPFLPLKSLMLVLGSEVLCLYRRFSERLYSCI